MHNAFKLPITETHNNNILLSIAIDPAKIKYQNSTVPVGGNTALVCLAEGYPAPNTTWIRDSSREIVGFGIEVPYSFAQLRVPILEVILAVQRTLQGLQTVQRFFLKLQVKAKFNITNL